METTLLGKNHYLCHQLHPYRKNTYPSSKHTPHQQLAACNHYAIPSIVLSSHKPTEYSKNNQMTLTSKMFLPCSLVKMPYCGEPLWPRGSVRSLRPPGREFRITCLEDNVISFISPPSGVCMYQGAFVHVQHVLKQFIFLYARGILESLLFLHRGRGNGHSPFRMKGDFPHLPSSTPFCYQGRYNKYNV